MEALPVNRRSFLAASLAATAGPLAAQPAKEKVKIVSSLPRQGGARDVTDGIVRAVRMAVADFEKGFPFAVEYLDWDDSTRAAGTWAAEMEKENAEKAAADKDVLAFIGPYNSGAARVSMPVLSKAGLVQVSPSATWPGLTKKVPTADADEPEKYRPGKELTFCRVCPHDASQGPLSADFAAEVLKARTVYIVDDKELYGTGLAGMFKRRCDELKVKVLAHESLARAASYEKTALKVTDAAPDLVYFGGTSQSGGPELARDLAKAKVKCPLMAGDGCYDPAFLAGAGPDALAALACYVTIGGINPEFLTGAGAEFVKRYRAAFGAVPDPFAVYGYEAAAAVLEALRLVGKKDREAVRRAVLGTRDFGKGLLGKWSFDADGDTTFQRLTVTKVEKGQFRAVKVLGAG